MSEPIDVNELAAQEWHPPEENLIFEWILPEGQVNYTGYDDMPEAYRIYRENTAHGGCIVYGRYGDEWKANPGIRALILHLWNLWNLSQQKEKQL